MKTNLKWLVLSGVLFFYAFLYIATSIDKKCDDVCQKFDKINLEIKKDSAVVYAYQCSSIGYCIDVNNTLLRNWIGLADSACMFIKNEGLQNYTVHVIDHQNQDTLLKQTCP